MRLRSLIAALVLWHLPLPAFAHHFRYTAYLTGPAESPPNASTAIGHAVITLDVDEVVMEVEATFSGLAGTVTAAHIHAPTAAVGSGTADVATQVPSFADFPLGVDEGDYDHEFDLADAGTYNPAFITSSGGTISDALNALFFALEDGKAYFNIHTTAYAGGEIRGFLSRVPGDYNDDGRVDAADYDVWRSDYGNIGEGLKADSDNDNVIGASDYVAWVKNFGRTGLSTPPGSGAVSTAAIPEPRALTLVAFALLAPIRRLRPA
jgi:hypothetical protein